MALSKVYIYILKIKIIGYQRISALYDFALYKSGFLIQTQAIAGKTILYIGANLPPRIARMIKWLKRNGDYHAVLICQKAGYHKKFSNDYFDSIVLFRNKWHLYRILGTINHPKLIHAFGPKSYYPDLAREFMKGTKFIYDMQDVLITYYGVKPDIKWFNDEFPHEKNCLEHADGIVSHGLEPIAGFKLYKIKKNSNILFFPLYCDDDVFQSNNKTIDQEIHIVYAGEIQDSHRDSKQFGNIQFHDLINEMSRQKLHFHVYPSPSTPPVYFIEYSNISKQNPFFHLHESVSQKALIEELSKYHFGIIPFFKENTAQSEYKYRYSTSLKLFNFIEAGIPVIVSKDITFQCWMAERYGAGVPVVKNDIPNLRQIIKSLDYTKLQQELFEKRQNISLKNNIYRLAQFYNKIAC